jgi:O-antigen/teichoic acid export membrane protein
MGLRGLVRRPRNRDRDARADRLVVGGWLGDRSLGLYDRSVFLAETGALALRPVSQLVFNLYARLQEDPRRLARAPELVGFGTVRVSVAGALTLAVFPEETIRLLLGPDFLGAAPTLRWLSIYAAVLPLAETLKALLLASGRAAAHARIRLAQLAVLAPGIALAARTGSAAGVAAVLSATWILGTLLAAHAVRGTAPWSARLLAGPLVTAAVIAGAFLASERAGLLAAVPFQARPFPPLARDAAALVERSDLLEELRHLREQLRMRRRGGVAASARLGGSASSRPSA